MGTGSQCHTPCPPPRVYSRFLASFPLSTQLPFAALLFNVRRRQWHPTPVLLPGKSHLQRSLVGCSPWGREESDTTEWLHFYFSLSCIGEGNGNPLQCSCLENPRDGGAWWAVIYRVAQSRTQLKQLSIARRLAWPYSNSLTFWGIIIFFPKGLHHFTHLSTLFENPNLKLGLTSLSIFIIVCFSS